METNNYCHLITMDDYDAVGEPEAKRNIAQGFMECRDATEKLNLKYIEDLQKANADLAAYRALGTPEEIKARLEKCVELPCNVGDRVFILDMRNPVIIEKTVECVQKYKKGFAVRVHYHNGRGEKDEYTRVSYSWNKSAFSTREAAEARLKELQNEHITKM